ncbi:hypothetical protein EHS13_30060 [Paenibacillus psychroresistens]|uniref:TcaA protein NTF2-like domain-containing protein n=1 Tax=Paenibacillus psychroresistens TaxID=1778678 RepID=A0A6B8RSV1_9BACL|nr:hypothetical protein [Paenibacillus psychroresistens]QGQ98822.1 hypothetical protein EHS13_30060 [Paenibacillus psychroresistens]
MRKVIVIAFFIILSACDNSGGNEEKPTQAMVSNGTNTAVVSASSPAMSVQPLASLNAEVKGNAEQCMESLIKERDKYNVKGTDDKDKLVMNSIISSQLYLNRKYGVLFDIDNNTTTDLAYDPLPIFFDNKADVKLVYPNLSYQTTSISLDFNVDTFNKMIVDWSGTQKPWEVDASTLKVLDGCSILPFKEIKFSSEGGAKRKMMPQNRESNSFDYINTLNMWSDRDNASKEYNDKIKQANEKFESSGVNQQFVYLYCNNCEIKYLVLKNKTEDKVTELVFNQVEVNEGWHTFMAETMESPWLDFPPYLLDNLNGSTQFILNANDQIYNLTNQYARQPVSDDSANAYGKDRLNLAGNYYAGQSLLTIDLYEGNLIKGSLSYASSHLSKIAKTEFSGELHDNKLEFNFEGDGYVAGETSKGVLTLNEDSIKVELQIHHNNKGWSLPDGSILFSKSLKEYTPKELTTEELNIIDIENYIDFYVDAWTVAVNDNDFGIIGDSFVEGSEIYSIEKNYVQESYAKGSKLKLRDCVNQTRKINKNEYEVAVTMKVQITENDQKSTKTMNKVFTVDYQDRIAKISKIENQ